MGDVRWERRANETWFSQGGIVEGFSPLPRGSLPRTESPRAQLGPVVRCESVWQCGKTLCIAVWTRAPRSTTLPGDSATAAAIPTHAEEWCRPGGPLTNLGVPEVDRCAVGAA
jgi:hypothetical protein